MKTNREKKTAKHGGGTGTEPDDLLNWAINNPDKFRSIARQAFAEAGADPSGAHIIAHRRLKQVVIASRRGDQIPTIKDHSNE